MLESEAEGKWCPFTFSGTEPQRCAGSHCMGWDEWKKAVRGDQSQIVGWNSYDPPQGDCGMKPKDIELP